MGHQVKRRHPRPAVVASAPLWVWAYLKGAASARHPVSRWWVSTAHAWDGLPPMASGAEVPSRRAWALSGCAAAPWSCAAPRRPAPVDGGFCMASCTRVVDVHRACFKLGWASADGIRG